MKLDFDYLREVSTKLHQLFLDAGGYNRDEHVYTVSVEPEKCNVRCHISWPYFRKLLANEPAASCEMSKSEDTVHLRARVHGVEVTCCIFRHDVEQMLRAIEGAYYHWAEEDTVVEMFKAWQNYTGWPVEVIERGW